MNEYIDKGAAKRAVDMALELDETEYKKVCAAIDNVIPAADAVPVIRCKDCKHGKPYRNMFGINGFKCELLCVDLSEEAFCSYSERKYDGR